MFRVQRHREVVMQNNEEEALREIWIIKSIEQDNEPPTWNFRYMAYCRAHGRSPDDQMGHDIEKYPGGYMAGFVNWINDHWKIWSSITGETKQHGTHWSEQQHKAFDAWLREIVKR